jgi:hypothetical protein
MHIKYIPFSLPGHEKRSFSVVIDGKAAGRYTAAGSGAQQLDLPIDGNGPHAVDITIENPLSPKELGLSRDDDRKLGIGIMEMRLATRRAEG